MTTHTTTETNTPGPDIHKGEAPPPPSALAQPSASATPPLTSLVAASILSALSLAWTAWSVADMIPAPWPVALAAGIALDVALVAAVAIAWVAPAAARSAQWASWAIAALATAAIGVHAWGITPALALLAPVPLVAKGLWHLVLLAKSAADAAAAADRRARNERSEELDHSQLAQLAARRKQAAFERELAEADVALADAQAQADQRLKLAEIARQNELRMAEFQANADLEVRRAEQLQRVRLSAPLQAHALSAVPDDASGLTPPQHPQAGFADAFAAAGATDPAQCAPGVPTPVPGGEETLLSEAERNRRAVLAAYQRLSTAGTAPSITAVATAAGVSRRTAGRHLS